MTPATFFPRAACPQTESSSGGSRYAGGSTQIRWARSPSVYGRPATSLRNGTSRSRRTTPTSARSGSARGICNLPPLGPGWPARAGCHWSSTSRAPNDSTPTGRVTVRRAVTGHWNGLEVESWPLFAMRSTWERIPGAADRRRDIAMIDEAAHRVAELAKADGQSQRPRYARLRSSLSSSSDAAPSSTISPVEST